MLFYVEKPPLFVLPFPKATILANVLPSRHVIKVGDEAIQDVVAYATLVVAPHAILDGPSVVRVLNALRAVGITFTS